MADRSSKLSCIKSVPIAKFLFIYFFFYLSKSTKSGKCWKKTHPFSIASDKTSTIRKSHTSKGSSPKSTPKNATKKKLYIYFFFRLTHSRGVFAAVCLFSPLTVLKIKIFRGETKCNVARMKKADWYMERKLPKRKQ